MFDPKSKSQKKRKEKGKKREFILHTFSSTSVGNGTGLSSIFSSLLLSFFGVPRLRSLRVGDVSPTVAFRGTNGILVEI